MAAGNGGNGSARIPREARESCSSPSHLGPRLLLISFPDNTAGLERCALQAVPVAPGCLPRPGRVGLQCQAGEPP